MGHSVASAMMISTSDKEITAQVVIKEGAISIANGNRYNKNSRAKWVQSSIVQLMDRLGKN